MGKKGLGGKRRQKKKGNPGQKTLRKLSNRKKQHHPKKGLSGNHAKRPTAKKGTHCQKKRGEGNTFGKKKEKN